MPANARAHAHINATDLRLERGGRTIIEDLNLTIAEGSRVAIVGENGRGKSTLLLALAGRLETSSGFVNRFGRIGVADQEMPAAEGSTVGDAVDFAIDESRAALAALDEAAISMSEGGSGADDDFAAALAAATRLDAWDAERRVAVALESLGAETRLDRRLAELSVGQRYRVRLACLLGGDAGILLLDEPTNHLDAAGLAFLSENLRARAGGFAVVSHDRALLRDVAEVFVDLDPSLDGRPRLFGGGYDGYREGKAAERARWEQQHAEQLRTEAALRADLQSAQSRLSTGWRPDKGTGKHQRASRAPGIVQSVKRRQEALDAHAVAAPAPPLRFRAPDGVRRAGGTILAADEVRFDGRFDTAVTLAMRAGDRLLVRGPNGAGKSTLLGILTGAIEPTGGAVTRHPEARIEVLTQESALPGSRTAAAVYRDRADRLVSNGVLAPSQVSGLASLGLLGSAETRKRVGELSIGQQRRLDLALRLLARPDVLILDEPTNHLSFTLVDELTEALSSSSSAVIVSSHDRQLLRDLADWESLTLCGSAHTWE